MGLWDSVMGWDLGSVDTGCGIGVACFFLFIYDYDCELDIAIDETT